MSPADDTRTREVRAAARAWLIRLRSGEATQDDIEAYRRWCDEHPEHARMAHILSEAWSTLNTVAAQLIEEHPDEHPTSARSRALVAKDAHPLRPGRRAFVGFALAAGASWLALRPPLQLWPSLGDFAADYRTGTGQHRQVALSDRVMVEMNTQTRINLLPAQTAQSGSAALHGVELLAGEAEITAGTPGSGAGTWPIRPVVVAAGRGRLQASVARFDIRRTGDEVCVTCVSGSVALEHPLQRLTLVAAQQVVFDDNHVRPVSQVDPAAVTAWRRGLLMFNRVPLAGVVDEINRYRPGKLILRKAEVANSLVQAQVSLARLDDAIDMLGNVYDMHVTRLPGNIALLG
jgi:transmembrane sensor